MRGEPGVQDVIDAVFALDDKIKKQDEELRAAKAVCDARRKEDAEEFDRRMEEKVGEHQRMMEKKQEEYERKVDELTAKFEKHYAEDRMIVVLLSLRQIAFNIRNYYARKVGGVSSQENGLPHPDNLRLFLEKVGRDEELTAKLTRAMEEDNNTWKWKDLCSFCTFANATAHPPVEIKGGSRYAIGVFFESETFHTTLQTWNVRKRDKKRLLRSFIQFHDTLFENMS